MVFNASFDKHKVDFIPIWCEADELTSKEEGEWWMQMYFYDKVAEKISTDMEIFSFSDIRLNGVWRNEQERYDCFGYPYIRTPNIITYIDENESVKRLTSDKFEYRYDFLTVGHNYVYKGNLDYIIGISLGDFKKY